MTTNQIFDELSRLGIRIELEGEGLKASGASEKLTPRLVDTIKTNKAALIAHLRTKDRDAVAPPSLSPLRKTLEFSLFYFGTTHVEDESEKYKLLIEGAKFADRNGFLAVWTPERHFDEFAGLYPNPSVLGAALASVTKNISIRAGSVVVPLHHPLRIAEEWSVVDNLSGGRIAIACAPGWHANDFVLAPDLYKERHEVMYEKLGQVRRLWRGESIELVDGSGGTKRTRIYPNPIQKELPVWITSAGNINSFISAGEKGFNIITHLLGDSLEGLAVKIAAYRKAYRESGHDETKARVSLMLHTYIGDTLEATYAVARGPFIEYLRNSLGLVKNLAVSLGYDITAQDFRREDLDGMLEYAFNRYVNKSSLVGTKEFCMEMLGKVSAIGVDEIASLIDFGIDVESTLKSLHYLTEIKDAYNL